MAIAILADDLVSGTADGDVDGLVIPSDLSALPIERLRYDGAQILDAEGFDRFFIDSMGQKHIVRHDPAWPELICQLGDALISDGETWRVANAGDDLVDAQNAKIAEINAVFDATVREPVLIDVNGTTYRMDGQENSARRMDEGVELAERAGETSIDIIDYDNVPHVGISLADGKEIATQQGLAYRANYYKRAQLRYLVMQAGGIEALDAITWE